MPYCDKVYIKEISGFTFDQCQLSPERKLNGEFMGAAIVARRHKYFLVITKKYPPDEMEHEIELQSINVSKETLCCISLAFTRAELFFSKSLLKLQIVPR